jgi:undecaprenyl-diphosphatase
MEYLSAIDRSLFLFINHLPHNALFDAVASVLSGIGKGGLIWFVFAAIIFFREEKRDHWFFLPFAISGFFGSIFSEILIKFLVARPRPVAEMGAIVLADPGNYSFPSTHTTLAFAMAYILSLEEPKLRTWFYLLAVCISLSRIYLGVHYPIDVVCGAIIGTTVGWASFVLGRAIANKYSSKKNKS